MTYYELDTVRKSLNIAPDDAEDDGFIKIAGTRADGIIDNKLAPYFTVPLTGTIDYTIKQASNALVMAYYYRKNDATDPRAEQMFSMAYGMIDDYIKTQIATGNTTTGTIRSYTTAYRSSPLADE